MSRVIGVLSGKGGVGKTTVVANLGAALTNVFNKNVLIFDSNINTSHLGLHLGIYDELSVTLREVLRKKAPVLHAIYLHPTTGIRILPAPLSGSGLSLTKEECCNLVNEIKNNYDMVILDCAPGLGKEVIVAVSAIDEAIIVTTADIPAVTDAMKTIHILEKLGKKSLGIVVNRYRNKKYELTPYEISSTCKCDVIVKIPEDIKIPESISEGVPAVMKYPYSPASIEINKLAAHLLGEEYRPPNIIDRIKNLLGLRIIGKEQAIFAKKKKGTVLENEIEGELSDLEKLKNVGHDIKKDIKKMLKKKIAKRLKERLK